MPRPFLTADWRSLLMINYPVDPALLEPLIPRGTALDIWNGNVFISLVGFRFLRTRVLGIPIPFHRDFDEVNLRFYVRREGPDGTRRGVAFLSEIVPKRAVVAVARGLYGEKYRYAPMQSRTTGPRLEFAWGRGDHRCSISARPDGEFALPEPGSVGEFIVEHYWGYTRRDANRTDEYRVAHPTWRITAADDCRLEGHFESWYGKSFADVLATSPHSALIAEGSPVQVFPGTRL